ncbi:hypothetical protein [Novosphingobium kaempferiae]|uniref:hypothetical protein n=1 Tax=Novosphingobium kaempferiae TaxID=2896849 RepID=UPI001E4B8DDE|nr:hypothetical protein [Novosphingobium kaempferiae]
MSEIGKNWNGYIFGTNTGKVSVQMEGENNALTGIIRIADDNHGVSVFNVTGTYIDGKIELKGKVVPASQASDIQYGEITVSGALTPEGRLNGQWSSTIGTGGTFQLYPHLVPSAPLVGPELEQLNTAVRTLGAVRLYADNVRALIQQICKDFTAKRPIVTYFANTGERTVYAEDFDAILDTLPDLQYLKINIQEPEKNGINKVVIIELTSSGENVIRVQSAQESWAIGKAEALLAHLRDHQRSLATHFRKFGLTPNLILNVVSLAALPGLSDFWRRLAFAISVLCLQTLYAFLHQKFVPNFVLYSAVTKPSRLAKIWPGAASWFLALVGTVLGAIIYGVLQGELNGKSPLLKVIHEFLRF